MKRIALLLAVSLVAVSCASRDKADLDPVARAVRALGGVDALRAINTVAMKGTIRYWEPEQSKTPGGEMRLANESTFETVTDARNTFTRIDWVRKFEYPSPRTFTFTEIIASDVGYVSGIDSNGRTKQSLESNPPAHTMSGLRLAAAQRELRRTSALLLLEMYQDPARVYSVPDVTVGGIPYPAVEYRVPGQTLTVLFDRPSGTWLPVRIRTNDYDNMWGDVAYDLVLSDWKTFGGIQVATARKYELNGRPVVDIKVTDVVINGPVDSARFGVPAAFLAGAPKPATGAVPFQWILRRQFIGTYLDSDAPSYDTRASQGLRFVELAPGIQHVVGGSHNSLLVEMRDHLIVFDAPISDWQSNWLINAAKAKYPNKPVKYLILTHHHMDHAGGIRAYAAQGAALVVGQGAAQHYRGLLAAPYTRNPDLTPPRDLSKTEIIEVVDKRVFSDGARQVEAYVIENPHADSTLIGYIPDARLGYVTDIWSPGAGPMPDRLNPNTAALVAGVKKAGISPTKFAGGHGSTADYAPLANLEGR